MRPAHGCGRRGSSIPLPLIGKNRYFPARFYFTSVTGEPLELPTSHRVPVTWLREHACPSIRFRMLTEILPPDATNEPEIASLRKELSKYKAVTQTERKQRPTGLWASNILGTGPSKSLGIKDVGTVAQYRRLLELGVPTDHRSIQLANRVFFRLLSRDEDPKLLFEFQKPAKTNPELGAFARDTLKEAVASALAHGGLTDDPRVRGAANTIVNALAQFLRDDVADQPIITKSSRNTLHPGARPPTIHSVALLAYMPAFQRERAGVIDRLTNFLSRPAPKKTYVLEFGKKTVKPTTQLLGDPLQNDSTGRPKDLPFALHWMELLARLNAFEGSTSAARALAHLLKDCNNDGVWHPKNLRALPKSPSGLADFSFPLENDAKKTETRRTDVTFRIALLAKMLGMELEFT